MIYIDNERIAIKYLTDISKLSVNKLDAEIEKGYQDMLAGRTVSVKKVFADIRKDYGLEDHHAKEKR